MQNQTNNSSKTWQEVGCPGNIGGETPPTNIKTVADWWGWFRELEARHGQGWVEKALPINGENSIAFLVLSEEEKGAVRQAATAEEKQHLLKSFLAAS